jgi:formylmethanofuran dehydrogenase subunit E
MPNVDSGFRSLLEKAASFHGHMCGGQPLGVRMAMAGLRELGMTKRSKRHDLIVYVEVGRCIADAIQVVTGCTVGHGRLKLVDYGKFAATFVDISSGKAVRIVSRKDARTAAMRFAEKEKWIKPGEREAFSCSTNLHVTVLFPSSSIRQQ